MFPFPLVQAFFTFSVVWSIGCTTEADGREKFDLFYRELISGHNTDYPVPDIVGKIEVPLPAENKVYDYMFEVRNYIRTYVHTLYMYVSLAMYIRNH